MLLNKYERRPLVCLVVAMVAVVAEPDRQLSAAPQEPTETEAVAEPANHGQHEAKDNKLTPEMLALGLLSGPIVWDDKPLDVDWADLRKLSVRVLDEHNRPFQHARVTLGTLHDKAGTMASVMMVGGMQTDDQGIAQVLIPGGTARVGLHASAAGYATQRADFNASGKIEFRLQPGRTITVRATDEAGKLLPMPSRKCRTRACGDGNSSSSPMARICHPTWRLSVGGCAWLMPVAMTGSCCSVT